MINVLTPYFEIQYFMADGTTALCRPPEESAGHVYMYGDRQLYDIRDYTLNNGRAKGVRCIDVDCGELVYTIIADRCMDIYGAKYKSRQYAFLAPGGLAAPSFYDADGFGWLKTFAGGLMATCGLANAGDPCEWDGERHGLHGRISHQPAEQVSVSRIPTKDGLEISVTGEIHEYALMGARYRLNRKISSRVGGNTLRVEDCITNLSDVPQPLMLLYHLNLGYPLVHPDSRITVSESVGIQPFDDNSRRDLNRWNRLWEPAPGAAEQVFLHSLKPDGGSAFCGVQSALQALAVRFDTAELPYLGVWKSLRPNEYAVALEPCNNHIRGVRYEKEHGGARMLAPGEKVCTWLEFIFS